MSIFRSKKAPGADRINIHQRNIINSSEVSVVFYKDTIFHKPSGTLLVDSKKHELHKEIIRFSIVSLGPPRELTPALLATIFDQALEAGFHPISLVSYKGVTFDHFPNAPVNMLNVDKSTLNTIVEYGNHSMEVGTEGQSLFVMEVLNASSRTNYTYRPIIKGVTPGSHYITPRYLDQVFEAVKALGLIPGYFYPVPPTFDRPVSNSPEFFAQRHDQVSGVDAEPYIFMDEGHKQFSTEFSSAPYMEHNPSAIVSELPVGVDTLLDQVRSGDYSRAQPTSAVVQTPIAGQDFLTRQHVRTVDPTVKAAKAADKILSDQMKQMHETNKSPEAKAIVEGGVLAGMTTVPTRSLGEGEVSNPARQEFFEALRSEQNSAARQEMFEKHAAQSPLSVVATNPTFRPLNPDSDSPAVLRVRHNSSIPESAPVPVPADTSAELQKRANNMLRGKEA